MPPTPLVALSILVPDFRGYYNKRLDGVNNPPLPSSSAASALGSEGKAVQAEGTGMEGPGFICCGKRR
jgi:hypothetical protein